METEKLDDKKESWGEPVPKEVFQTVIKYVYPIAAFTIFIILFSIFSSIIEVILNAVLNDINTPSGSISILPGLEMQKERLLYYVLLFISGYTTFLYLVVTHTDEHEEGYKEWKSIGVYDKFLASCILGVLNYLVIFSLSAIFWAYTEILKPFYAPNDTSNPVGLFSFMVLLAAIFFPNKFPTSHIGRALINWIQGKIKPAEENKKKIMVIVVAVLLLVFVVVGLPWLLENTSKDLSANNTATESDADRSVMNQSKDTTRYDNTQDNTLNGGKHDTPKETTYPRSETRTNASINL